MGSATHRGPRRHGREGDHQHPDLHRRPQAAGPRAAQHAVSVEDGVSEAHASLLARLADAVAGFHPDRRIRVAIDGVDGARQDDTGGCARAAGCRAGPAGDPRLGAMIFTIREAFAMRAADIRPTASISIPTITIRFGGCCSSPWAPAAPANTPQSDSTSTMTGRSIWIRNKPSRRRRSSSTASSCIVRVAVLLGPFDISESRFRRLAAARCGARPELRCDRSQLAAAPALCRRSEAIPRRMCSRAAGRHRDRLQRSASAGDFEVGVRSPDERSESGD